MKSRAVTSRLVLLISLLAVIVVLKPVREVQASVSKQVKDEKGNVEMSSGGTGKPAKSESKGAFAEGEVLVKFKAGVTDSRKAAKHGRLQATVAREHKDLRLQKVRLKAGMTVEEAIADYQADPEVEYAEPNYLLTTQRIPDDPQFFQLWGMSKISAPAAWDLTTGDGSAVVAIIDTGIDYTHPDLKANLWINSAEANGIPGVDDDGNGYIDDIYGYNARGDNGDPKDDHFHGTAVAGVIAAVGNNAKGVAGVAWNTKVMACKFIGSNGSGDIGDAIACLEYIKAMKRRGVNIVATNNSWGGSPYSQAMHDAIADQQEILFVAAAGNNGSKSTFYPAGYDLPNVLSVGATDQNDFRASFSNYGNWVDIAAPGVGIFTTTIGGLYATYSGTSLAAPHVTGLVALLKTQGPNRSVPSVKNLLMAVGDNVPGYGTTATGKRINAYKSLTCSNAPLFSILEAPENPQPGVPQKVAVLSVNCATPVGPVSLALSTGGAIELHDDGAGPDQAAGDGIFTATWTPATSAVEVLSFSSPIGTSRVASPPVALASEPTLLPSARVVGSVTFAGAGTPFSQTFAVSRGVPPYTWFLAAGSLPSGLTFNSQTGEISGRTGTLGAYPFTIQATDAVGGKDQKEWTIVINSALREGWPYELQLRSDVGWNRVPASPVLADLDGDGKDEIVVADMETLYVIHADGSSSKTVLPGRVSAPAVADLDGDGEKEIIVSVSYHYSSAHTIYAFHSDLTPVAGFPAGAYPSYNGGPGQVSMPVVADLDGDGSLELLVAATPNNIYDINYGKTLLLMVDSHGRMVAGWPQFASQNGDLMKDFSAPAVADLDGDGKKEVVTAGWDGYVRIFKPDGVQVKQWQFETSQVTNLWKPILGDLDGDGIPEIVVKHANLIDGNIIAAYAVDGRALPGWPKSFPGMTYQQPVVADVDGDGAAEVVVVAGGYWQDVHVLRGDGSDLSGWPTSNYGGNWDCTPVVGDVDGDGKQEVIITGVDFSDNGKVYAFAANGAALAGFPKNASPGVMLASSAALGDLDGNGKLDVVAKSENGLLFAWEMPQSVGVKDLQWPVVGGDAQHTGAFLAPLSNLLVTPRFSNFPDLLPGTSSAARTLTISNPLPASAVLSSITTQGAGGFVMSDGSCGVLPVTLSPKQSCTVKVTFAPGVTGDQSATMLASSSSSGVRPGRGYLSGRGAVNPYTLSYTKAGAGRGLVSTSTGYVYSQSGSEIVESGRVVTLTATPAEDSLLSGWTGCDSVSGAVCTVTMSSAKSPTATFAIKTFTLTAAVAAGSGIITPASATVLYGESVTFTATPVAGFYVEVLLDNGQGVAAIKGSGDSYTYTVDNVTADHSLAVTFALLPSTPPPSVTALAAGYGHSLALLDNGTVWAWGMNESGQLGDRTNVNRSEPVEVLGLTDVVAIAAGGYHSLALKRDGTLWAWGSNSRGELGDGTTTPRSSPVQVAGISGVAGVYCGFFHSLARKSDGTVWSWGYNYSGELGDGTSITRVTPVQVLQSPGGSPLTGVTVLAAGDDHAIALKDDGTIWSWGANDTGQLGDGTMTKRYVACPVAGPFSSIVAVAAGTFHTHVLDSNGVVWGWGGNFNGQLGDGTTTRRYSPVAISGLDQVAKLTAGGARTAALKKDGTVWGWGNKLVGDGSDESQASPVQVAELSGVAAFASGGNHVLVLKSDNTLWGWGGNSYGELGDGTTTSKATRTLVRAIGNPVTPFASIGGTPAGTTTLASATLSVGGSGVVSYRYRMDGGDYGAETPVTTPISLASLSDGSHIVAVIGKDGGGKWQSQPTTTAWTVDTTPPTAAVTGAPATSTNVTSATLTVGGAGVTAYRYKVDGGSYSTDKYPPTKIELYSLTAGPHSVSVIAEDRVGNWQVTPTIVSWTVDLTPPTATLSGTPPKKTNATGATLTVGGTDVVSYKYKLDSAAYSGESTVATPITLSGLSEGTHNVWVLGKDTAGNWQTAATLWNWSIDLTPPATTPAPGAGSIAPATRVTLTCSDVAGSGCGTIRYCLGTSCTPGTTYSGGITINASTDLRFYSTDQAGNSEAVKTATYTVATDYALNLTITGSGGGTVISSPAGISASSSSSGRFPIGSTVTLTAAPGEFSLFAGWSGACSGTGACVVSMTSDRAASATFGIDFTRSTYTGAGVYSSSIQNAFDASTDSDVIRLWGIEFNENILFSRDKKTTIKGGYNQTYTSQQGVSVLRGSVRIAGGTVNIERLAIK